jgi:hypothetical protein
MKAMLTNAGNIRASRNTTHVATTNLTAVDRKTKNNQKLFLGTFEGASHRCSATDS